jgi:sortase (surface protein transpeptidase)
MDVPRGWSNAGWFLHGFRPGEVGNSVIAGHLDTNTGGPAVFWNLNRLRPGDEVSVTYENGDRYTFIVQGSELFDADAEGPVIERIFGTSLTQDLNLVTCDGAWDHGRATYAKRLVVFTTLAPDRTVLAGSEGSID